MSFDEYGRPYQIIPNVTLIETLGKVSVRSDGWTGVTQPNDTRTHRMFDKKFHGKDISLNQTLINQHIEGLSNNLEYLPIMLKTKITYAKPHELRLLLSENDELQMPTQRRKLHFGSN